MNKSEKKIKRLINLISAIDNIDDLNVVIDVIKIKQKALKATRTAVKKALFNVGDTVNIDSKKGLLVGTITKMNRTRAICEIKGKAYNVPFGMMEAV